MCKSVLSKSHVGSTGVVMKVKKLNEKTRPLSQQRNVSNSKKIQLLDFLRDILCYPIAAYSKLYIEPLNEIRHTDPFAYHVTGC